MSHVFFWTRIDGLAQSLTAISNGRITFERVADIDALSSLAAPPDRPALLIYTPAALHVLEQLDRGVPVPRALAECTRQVRAMLDNHTANPDGIDLVSCSELVGSWGAFLSLYRISPASPAPAPMAQDAPCPLAQVLADALVRSEPTLGPLARQLASRSRTLSQERDAASRDRDLAHDTAVSAHAAYLRLKEADAVRGLLEDRVLAQREELEDAARRLISRETENGQDSAAAPGSGSKILDRLAIAFSRLAEGEPRTFASGHHDLGDRIWISTDPAGDATIRLEPAQDAWHVRLSKGSSGAWACLGMRFPPQAIHTASNLFVLMTAQSDKGAALVPTLRYYLEDRFVDRPQQCIFEGKSGMQDRVVSFTIEPDLLAAATGCELNLFFAQDSAALTIARISLVAGFSQFESGRRA
jgi:hypothetical protein